MLSVLLESKQVGNLKDIEKNLNSLAESAAGENRGLQRAIIVNTNGSLYTIVITGINSDMGDVKFLIQNRRSNVSFSYEADYNDSARVVAKDLIEYIERDSS